MSVDGPPAADGSQPYLTTPSLVGQVLDGRYRLVRKLGEGGMGEVYAADHVHIDKHFAVKLLRPEIVSNREAVQRFRQEAQSSSSIRHRNIIAVEDFGDLPDGRIYMCMELLDGAPLNDMIQQPMPIDRLLNILIQTGHGLAAAHAKQIVHRDMKPENIFVTHGPAGDDIPKLLDFGIAKVAGNDGQNNLTRTGTIFGTPFYMAPEQALGNPVDARTDIYAVGVIMYEVFAGSLPFQGESFMGILTQHITTEPEPVAQRAAKAGRQLPHGLADVITRAMQKNPAQRFQTMDELVNALVQIYRGIAGPGMSTYMAAFPQSSVHPALTPPPQSGPVVVPMGPGSQPFVVPSGPHQTPISAPHVIQHAPQKKSKTGLIIGIVVGLLVLGGGAAAFIILSQDNGDKKDIVADGSDKKGSDELKGSDKKGSDELKGSDKKGSDELKGSDHVGSDGIKSGSDHVGSDHVGSDHVGSDHVGSDHVENPPPVIDAGVTLPATVHVLLMTKNGVAFEAFEDGKKVLDGPDELEVTPGTARTLVIKAKGFVNKTITVNVKDNLATCTGVGCLGDTKKKKVTFGLDRVVIRDNHHDNPPPPRLDCHDKILDAHDKQCRAQYCASHEDDVRCGVE